MERGSPRARTTAIIVGCVAVATVLILVVGFGDFGWGSSGTHSSSGQGTPSGLSITFAADSDSEVNFLLTSARPYIESGDSFDLVSGSPENSSLSVSNVNSEAQELRSAYPGDAIYAHTAGIAHYSSMSAGVGSDVSGVFYDYEPGFEPEFTYNFTQTVSSFENASAEAHAHGLLSVGYPIGKMLLDHDYLQYDWNYATLALAVDRLVIQIQTYCVQGPSMFGTAIATTLDQYKSANLTNVPTFQITIGNSTTHLPNGVTATPAFDCAQELSMYGLHTLYIWFDEGGESNVIEFLQDLGR